MTDRYTHVLRTPRRYAIHLLWIVRKNDQCPIVLSPRYASQAEAECAALGLNHADADLAPFRGSICSLWKAIACSRREPSLSQTGSIAGSGF
jgi:hypothetical protein